MIRTFETHEVRKQKELTGKLWEFEACQGELAGKKYQVATPCCWQNLPEFTDYRGEGFFRTRFQAKGRVALTFKGVSHTATVYVDGKEVGFHYNAYTAFTIILNDLEQGEHLLEVKADNRFSEKSALHVPNDYMAYGGVSRPVVLEKLPEVYIEWIHVTPKMEENGWSARVEVCVINDLKTDAVRSVDAEVAGQQIAFGNVVCPAGEQSIFVQTLAFADVEPWTMESPVLYEAKATLAEDGTVTDDLIDRFGFREVKLEGKRITLNGKAVRIKGFCRHEDHPQFGCALPFAVMSQDLDIMKHMGANSVRITHYPSDELFLDLCDERGFLVWEENHARGLSVENMQNPYFEQQAEQVIREMIPLHYNHPCIYIWGILNECASDSEYGRECYEKQFALIKSLDQSRPHSFASCKFKTDICFGLPDVVSYNIYPLWYHDTPVDEYLDDLYQWVQNETGGKGKPFLITEIGAGGIYGYRAPHKAKWTEEYQAETLQKQVSAVLKYPENCGVYIWQYCDIRISEEWWFGRPRSMNNKGIVDEYRRRKMSYDVVKNIFEEYGNYFED